MLRLVSGLVPDTKGDISITGSKSQSPRRWSGKTIRAGGWTGVLWNAAFWIQPDHHNHEHTAATCKSLNHPANKDMGVRWGVLELCFQILWLALEERGFGFHDMPWRGGSLVSKFALKENEENPTGGKKKVREKFTSEPMTLSYFLPCLFCFWVNVEPKMSHVLVAILPLRYIPSPRPFYWNNLTN